jgi:hypothetical protein
MNTLHPILAFALHHGGRGFGGLFLIILALALIAAVFILTDHDRRDDKKS